MTRKSRFEIGQDRPKDDVDELVEFDFDFDAKIEFLGKKAGPNTTPKYEVITAGDHIRQKMENSLHK